MKFAYIWALQPSIDHSSLSRPALHANLQMLQAPSTIATFRKSPPFHLKHPELPISKSQIEKNKYENQT
jgi:hypothetical protein